MRNVVATGVLFVVIVSLAMACQPGADDPERQTVVAPAVDFDNATVRIETATDTFNLVVDIAETDEQRMYGLMERSHLPDDAGMIFLYPRPQPPQGSFFMYRTLIPLDIAFLDEEGHILAIRAMDPCGSPNPDVCRRYEAGVPYASALEVNRSFFEQNGIGLGDRVVLERPGGEGVTAGTDG